MLIQDIFALLNLGIQGTALLLFSLVHWYVAGKSPGQQTALDLCIMDLINVWKSRIIANSAIYFAIFLGDGKWNFTFALTLVFVHKLLVNFLFASCQMVLLLKTVLIFKGELISNVSDNRIHWGFRWAVWFYWLFLLGIGLGFAKPNTPFLLYLMTNSDKTT